MNSIELINLLSRWLHVSTAIVVLGGTVFMRFVLMPAADRLPPAEHEQLRDGIMSRWRRIVMAGIGLFLLTGFYNYIAVAAPKHHRDLVYHGLMGTKILLAFIVFFIASALVGRSVALEAFRRNRKFWLGTLIGCAFVIVLISSFLKIRSN